MSATSQQYFLLGAICLLLLIIWFLKRGVLCVKYSLLWLGCGCALLLFAAVPYLVYVIRDILDMVMPSNVVFLLLFAFVLLVLLSLSVGISELAEKSKRQTQSIALLELRMRALEQELQARQAPTDIDPTEENAT
ncbi:MAG: DUF2304 family protein [Faecalibacterium sp.]